MKKHLLALVASCAIIIPTMGTAKANFEDEKEYMLNRNVIENLQTANLSENLTRGEFATWIVETMGLKRVSNTVAFKDVDYSSPMGENIRIATDNHIINGYPDGTFKPQATLTRGQMVLLLQRAYKLKEGTGNKFSDVPEGELANTLSTLRSHGVVQGYSNNTFQPNAKVSKKHGVSFLSRVDKKYNKDLGLVLDEGVHFNLNRNGNFIAFKKNTYNYGGYVSGHLDEGNKTAFNNYFMNNYLFKTDGAKTIKITHAMALHESLVEKVEPLSHNDSTGEYRVGIDIPEGTYSLVNSQEKYGAYFGVNRDFQGVHTKNNIIRNNYFKVNEVVNVKNGEILVLTKASMMKIN